MDQPSKDFNKYGHNESVPSCGGEVQVARSIPGAINGADSSNLVYGNGKEEFQRSVAVRYRECLKNHAASIGSHAVDGCGEFMPRGAEGTEDAMKCMACACHRNFHRREVDGEVALRPSLQRGLYAPYGRNGLSAPYGMSSLVVSMAGQEGGDDERRRGVVGKKRFRTKFTAEQKEKMFGLAERIGWRIQKQDEAAVQRFCEEVGVRRHVLKVWMHNNKNSSTKKS